MNNQVNFLLVEQLKERKLTISTCESATCGALASLLGEVPGVSTVYRGGLITYSNDAKVILAEVNYETINDFGAISEQTAYEMAARTAAILSTDVAISITGNAGPTGDEGKPIGLFYVGLSVLGVTTVHQLNLEDTKNRTYNRLNAAWEALEILYNLIRDAAHQSVDFGA